MSIVFWEVVTVLVTASTKFFFSPFLAVNAYGFGLFETFLMSWIGGSIGIIVFYSLSEFLMRKAFHRRLRKEAKEKAKGTYKPKKIFTTRNKIIVRVKQKFGLLGLVVITPPILSIPIGSILAAKYFRRNTFTLPGLILSTAAWSLALAFIASLVGSPFEH